MTETAIRARERVLDGRQAIRQSLLDSAFKTATAFFALAVLLILGGVFASLLVGAWPALNTFGIGFVFSEVWNPVTGKFGALAPIYGTLVTALIAMLVGIPTSFGIAL